ncbi:MAG: WG repeat-containing protein [Eubacteriales bacterium]
MKYFFVKFKRQLIRAAQLALVFGVAALVLLYFLGYYDFSFLDRYKIFADEGAAGGVSSAGDFFSSMSDISDLSDENESAGTAADETNGGETGAADSVNNSAQTPSAAKYERYNISKVWDSSRLEDKTYSVPTVSDRQTAGFVVSEPTAIFAENSTLGKMTFSFKLPTKYSRGRRLRRTETVIFPEDDSEPYVQVKDVAEYRPAIELYMGYILMDNGDDIFLISSDGDPLSRFAYNKYKPAYMRNADGEPLFMKETEDGEVQYFSVSDDGKNFVYCDFDPETDGVGLRFDYPESYGKSDSDSVFVDKIEPEPPTEDGNETDSEAEDKAEAETEEGTKFGYIVKNADGSIKGMLTEYKFTSAYAFTENRGAVTESDNRGAMYFVNENGRRAFETVFTYVNEYGRYVTEYMLPPLTKGIENIGFYYFDAGLTRVRKQTVDYYNYEVRHVVRVVEDEDVLIRPDGSEYELPAGFTLEGYSEGVILLSKDGKYGFMRAEGEWIAQPIYTSATPFIGGLAVLETDDGRYGMIDRDGNIVLPFTYDSISQNSSGLIAAYREENGWSIFRVMEK